MKKRKILLLYTGGTIGMMQDPKSGSLCPFNFNHLSEQVPELHRLDIDLQAISFEKPIDSSNMHPDIWVKLAQLIEKHYEKVDGFVILHGSDTMAYTASALSFMLENLSKPVILTGSQLPIGIIRTDGKENLITSIEIAAACDKKGKALVPEVAIYFEYELYRGNRTIKYNSAHFDAFKSPNYPVLAEAGINIEYRFDAIQKPSGKKLKVHTQFNSSVLILPLFPGLNENIFRHFVSNPHLKGLILQTFGSGNACTEAWFLKTLQKLSDKGVVLLNITQCLEGKVIQGKYETSVALKKIGVIGGADLTMEAAVCKLMFLLGQGLSATTIRKYLTQNIRGEMSQST